MPQNGGPLGEPCDPTRLVTIETPWGVRTTINKALEVRFLAACEKANEKALRRRERGKLPWFPKRCDGYNCRSIRGSSTMSRHASGAANDWFDKPYPEPVDIWGATNAPPRWWAKCFTSLGFSWGASWISRKDYPHIEWATSTVPKYVAPVRDRFKITLFKVVTGPQRAKRILERRREQGWKGQKEKVGPKPIS